MSKELNPAHIMQVGMGFFASKVLLSAVELGLFTVLAKGGRTGAEIAKELRLSDRAVPDFTDALLALGFLEREGNGAEAVYSNTETTAFFLDRNSPGYIGGILEMANDRLYGFWCNLTEGLKTGEPQNEIKETGEPVFAKLYAEPERLEQFMNAMSGISLGNYLALANKFDFSKYKSLCDIGGATGQLASIVAKHHENIECATFDLPAVAPIAKKHVAAAGLESRVEVLSGDFFEGPLPKADVLTMGMILHDWNLEKKKMLIKKAYDSLPDGGAFIAVESIIDDDRRENAFGLLMSLNMLVEFGDAFDYTFADFKGWCEEVGFKSFEKIELAGPSSAVVAYK
jgi:hypothetical protein